MTQLELTSLRNMHLKGYFGFPFSAQPKNERAKLINKWIEAGYLHPKNGTLTPKGIEATAPSVQPS